MSTSLLPGAAPGLRGAVQDSTPGKHPGCDASGLSVPPVSELLSLSAPRARASALGYGQTTYPLCAQAALTVSWTCTGRRWPPGEVQAGAAMHTDRPGGSAADAQAPAPQPTGDVAETTTGGPGTAGPRHLGHPGRGSADSQAAPARRAGRSPGRRGLCPPGRSQGPGGSAAVPREGRHRRTPLPPPATTVPAGATGPHGWSPRGRWGHRTPSACEAAPHHTVPVGAHRHVSVLAPGRAGGA